MSICTLIAADVPLPAVAPPKAYPLAINLDHGTISDGGADDNYWLFPFADVEDYSEKQYGVSLEWQLTEGRARRLIAYIHDVLQKTDVVEIWRVWLMSCCEFEDRPVIFKKYISAQDLTAEHIKELEDAVIWNSPDKSYPNRPSFYCLCITREP